MKRLILFSLCVSILLLTNAPLLAQEKDAISEKAKKIHFASLVLDTHIDVTPKLQRELEVHRRAYRWRD
jgi:hypothetical protein